MDLDFGISSMVYHQKPIEKLLPYLKNSDINNIEIKPADNHFQPVDLNKLLKLKKLLDHNNINVVAVHMPLKGVDISHSQEYERIKSVREVEKAILVAFHLGADLVSVHPGAQMGNSDEKKKRLNAAIESLKEINDFSQNWMVKIALENSLPGGIGDKWEDFKEILDTISSDNLGICFDTGHHQLNYSQTMLGELDLFQFPIDWRKYLFHIHIHDNDGEHDQHLLPLKGHFPWPLFMRFIKSVNYQGVLVFEMNEQNYLSDSLSQTIIVWNKIKSMA